ncbi:MAG: hypothetical protein M3436_18570 [Pseudomonadota bacterium]|nr:hypothetical protein [Pseudomonadota bacterium]
MPDKEISCRSARGKRRSPHTEVEFAVKFVGRAVSQRVEIAKHAFVILPTQPAPMMAFLPAGVTFESFASVQSDVVGYKVTALKSAPDEYFDLELPSSESAMPGVKNWSPVRFRTEFVAWSIFAFTMDTDPGAMRVVVGKLQNLEKSVAVVKVARINVGINEANFTSDADQ